MTSPIDTSKKTPTSFKVCYVRCVAYAPSPELRLTRLRMRITQRNCCFPCFAKKRVVFALNFREDAWLLTGPSEWENVTPCCLVNTEGLRKLQADTPVQLKVWTRCRSSKVILKATLGDVLDQLESCTTPATFRITSTSDKFLLSYPAREPESSDAGIGAKSDPSNSGAGMIPLVAAEEVTPVTVENAPFAADEGTISEEEESLGVANSVSGDPWVTFVNKSTGMTLKLPAHTEAEKESRWRGPGAWTSEEDLLDAQALEIIAGISSKPVANKRSRFWSAI